MSPDTTRKPSRSDEDQSLLDADLLAIFGETPEAEAPASEPASEMPEPPSPEAEEPSPSIPEDGPEPEAQGADNAQASAAAEPDSMPEESAASAYDDAAAQTPPRSEAPEEPIYDNAPIYEAYQAEEAYAAAPPQASSTPRGNAGGEHCVFSIKNLKYAHCAALMEEKIRRLPGVSDVSIAYATQQLRVTLDNPEARLDQIRRICMSIEPDVEIMPLSYDTHTRSEERQEPHAVRNLAIGAGFLVVGALVEYFLPRLPLVSMFILCLSYVILGGEVLMTALGNIKNGRGFNETFLMSLATLGAVAMGAYVEAAGVMLVYRIGKMLERRFVGQSRRDILRAADLCPESVHRIDYQGVVHTIPAGQAQPGDLLLIRPGDRIPLDGIVRAGESRIDCAPLTGRSTQLQVQPDSTVRSGCINGTGALQLEVTHSLADSTVGRLLDAVEGAAASKSHMERTAARVSRIFTPAVVLIAVLTAIIPSVVTGEWGHWLYTALNFLILACPCALVLSVPLAFFAGIGAGIRRGILFRSGTVLEALKSVHAVVLDLASALTEGSLRLHKITPAHGMDETTLLSMAASCEACSSHPIAQAVLDAAQARGVQAVTPSKAQEIPGQGIVAMISGVTVLCGHRSLLDAAKVDLSGYTPAASGSEILVSAGGRFAGVLVVTDAVKPNAKAAMKRLRALSLITVLQTGRTADQAEAFAAKLDIQEVQAPLPVSQKPAALRQVRTSYGPTLYVGDGRDPASLAEATVGAAAGPHALDALDTAGMLFLTDDPQAIGDSIELARTAIRTARQNMIFALIVKIAVLLLGFAGITSLWLTVCADTCATVLCVLNAVRILSKKH